MGSEGDAVKFLEGEGRLGSPGRAWIIPTRGQEGEVICGGRSRGRLQAQGRIIFYSSQNSHCKISTESLLSYHWLKISFPCQAFQGCLLKTSLIYKILISNEFLATIL